MTSHTNLQTKKCYRRFGSYGQARLLASIRLLCTIIVLFCSLTSTEAQFTLNWTGNVSSDWEDPLNWIPTISPLGQNLIVLNNGSHAPVISNSISVHSIRIGPSADLSINAGVTLTLSPFTAGLVTQGVLRNQGTIINQGTINITGNAMAPGVPYAINNQGDFTNESTFPGGNLSLASINILSTDDIGIRSSGTFLNRGAEINIGTTGNVGGDGIAIGAGIFSTRSISFPRISEGTININNTTGDGIAILGTGVFTMTSGTLDIGIGNAIGDDGIDNEGTFNATGGTINIGGAASAGIHNKSGATFTNSSIPISIGTTSSGVNFGIQNFGTFNNYHTIDIKRATTNGLSNKDTGQFTNRAGASITVGSTQAIGVAGVDNNTTFTNRGTIDIISTNSDGLINNGTFNNLGGAVINIGTTNGSIGRIGLWNVGSGKTFTNNASTINIGNTGSVTPSAGFGLHSQEARFVNENMASINIGQNSNSTAKRGLSYVQNSTFINRNSTIKIDNTGGSGIQGAESSTLFNGDAGVIDIGQNQGNISGSGLMSIGAVVINDNATINIDRVGVMGLDIQQNGDVSTTNSGEINIGMNGGYNTIQNYGCSLFGFLSASGGTLNINNTANDGIFHVEGAITIDGNGQLNIGNSGGARNISGTGIDSRAFIQNFDGTIQINNTNGAGLFLDSGSTFVNSIRGTLNIGTNGTNFNVNGNGIFMVNIFQNIGGTINIEQTGRDGLFLGGSNNPSFTNLIDGNVNIFNTDAIGLRLTDGSFNNAANLTIGNTNDEAIEGVDNTSIDNRGGTLIIDGLIENITAVEGTLAPGNSPGEMSIDNAFDISATTLEIEIDGTTPITEHDVLDVDGVATIGGATLSISLNYTPTFNDRIVFIRASSVSGTFNNPTLPADWSLDYSVSGQVALVYDGISCLVSPKVFLQGPYNTTTTLLNDDLRAGGWVPILEPYSAMSGFTHVNGGGESMAEAVYNVSGNNAVVDWVFVELRDPSNPSVVLHTRSALLQRDGDIVDVTGGSDPVVFPLALPGDYYVVVRHRNHIAVRTASVLMLSSSSTTAYDFTSASAQAYGTAPMVEVSAGVWAMWGGNAKSDDNYVRVTPRVFPPPSLSSDRTYILDNILNGNPNGTFNGYSTGDINMDGFVRLTPRVFPPPSLESDATFILDEVLDGNPNATRTEQ